MAWYSESNSNYMGKSILPIMGLWVPLYTYGDVELASEGLYNHFICLKLGKCHNKAEI